MGDEFKFESREQREARLAWEAHQKFVTAKAKALEGVTFPVRVRALQDGSPRHANGKIVRVRKGDVFTIACEADFSHRWMAIVPDEQTDKVQAKLDRAPKRARRSGEGGNPDTPSWQQDPRAATAPVTDTSKSVI